MIESRSSAASTGSWPAGAYAYSSQRGGGSPASLLLPAGVTVDSAGHIWVVDDGHDRVQEFSATGEYIRAFGSEGTGNGQFKSPYGVVVDSKEDVWVTDGGNNRVQEFNSTGGYVGQFGKTGTENGQFKEPHGIAIDGKGNLWVVDRFNNRVQEFSSAGAYIGQFGKEGTENGQFHAPEGIAVDSKEDLWVVDSGNDRVEEFNATGGYVSQFGKLGSENGQFKSPGGIATDSKGNIWVVDTSNNRVQEFSSTGVYLSQFGSTGTGHGHFEHPVGVTADASGHLWVSDYWELLVRGRAQEFSQTGEYAGMVWDSTALKEPEDLAISGEKMWIANTSADIIEAFSMTGMYAMGVGSAGTGNGQFKNPHGITVDASGDMWVTDTGNDRVQEFSPTGEYLRQFGKLGSENGQLREPQGIGIDPKGNLWVADTGNNRVQEFSSTGAYISQFSTLLPRHIAVDASGNLWVAGVGVLKFSSTGKQLATIFTEFTNGIAIDANQNVWITSGAHVIELTLTGEKIRQFGKEGTGNGQLKKPFGIAIDTNANAWVADTANNRLQRFTETPAGPHASQTTYYGAQPDPLVPPCGGHPEWAGLPCRSQPAVQPSKGNPLPVVTDTYNMWDEPETVTEAFGTSTTRTKTSIYDTAGRLTGSEETSNAASLASLPEVSDEYDSKTGAMVKQSTTEGETTHTITSTYNKLGQLTEYTDTDKNKSTYTYDVDGRVSEMNDGKGTQTYTYDPTTGVLSKLVDSAAKTFTAAYDIQGKLTNETYPNGMSAKYTYDEAGQVTHVEYVKETHCASTCPETWFSESVAYSIHGQALSRTSSLASETYTYDNAARLTQVQETPTGKGCTVRLYAYDIESNRMSLATRQPGLEGKCATEGGTVENHAYDEANRLTDTGVSYDAFGNTTVMPATDAGGHEIKASYYVSNQTHTSTQNGKKITYTLDPEARTRETITEEGATKTTMVNHYPGPGSAISWSCEPEGKPACEATSKYTRNIPGIDGALTAVEQSGATPILQLHDLQGNIIATAALEETETKLLSTYNSTEFGVPTTTNPPPYSWLGATGLVTEFTTGTTAFTGAAYVPQLGQPLQTQPITPPGAAPEGIYISPYLSTVSAADYSSSAAYASLAPQREAARQAQARQEACEKNPLACASDIDPGRCVAVGGLNENFEWSGRRTDPYANFKCHGVAHNVKIELCLIAQEVQGEVDLQGLHGGGAEECRTVTENTLDTNPWAILLPEFQCRVGEWYALWLWYWEPGMKRGAIGWGKPEQCKKDGEEVYEQGIREGAENVGDPRIGS